MKRAIILGALASILNLRAATTYMLLGDGQSLSNGDYGCNAISTSQYGGNQTYNGSNLVALTETATCLNNTAAWASGSTFQPFSTAIYNSTQYGTTSQTTGVTPPAAPWVATSTQESPLSAALNNFSLLTGVTASVGNNFGVSGSPISSWGSSGKVTSMANTVTSVKSKVSPNAVVVLGVLVQGGESDYSGASNSGSMTGCSYQNGATYYYANSICFQQSLQAAIQAVTGQTAPVPVIYSQISSMMGYNNYTQTCPDGLAENCIDAYPVTSTASRVPIAQYQLARDSANPAVCGTTGYPSCGTFYLVGPKYHLDSGANQWPHLSAQGYNQLGAESARVLACLYSANFSTNNTCGGVMPQTPIYYNGNTVTLRVRTPGGIALDQPGNSGEAISGNWQNGIIPYPYYGSGPTAHSSSLGFQFFQTVSGSAQEIAINNVAISGTTITLTLASAPASNATNLQLAYAWEGLHYADDGSYGCTGNYGSNGCNNLSPNAGVVVAGMAHGNIRTIADYTDLRGDAIYHWIPHFIENVVPVPPPAAIAGAACSGCQF